MIQLYEHQQRVLDISKDKHSYAWFLETGTGKTILSLENIKYLYQNKKIGAVIITAPRTVLRPVWLKELEKYSSSMTYYVFQWIGDLSDYQHRLFNELIRQDRNMSSLIIFLINIEAFSHTRVYPIVTKILKRYFTLWIIDESTTIKSHSAKRTKGILKISHLAEYKRILSGYPVLKSPEDLYTQIQFLGQNLIPYSSFYSFRNEFCLTRQLDNRVTISLGARNIDKLAGILNNFSIRILKKECLTLPEKIRTVRYIPMTSEQKQYYNQMKERGMIAISYAEKHGGVDKQSFASTLLVQLEKLHQIANGLLISLDEYIECNKYDVLIDIIKNEIGDNQCVVWSSYTKNINVIRMFLSQHRITNEIMFGETPINYRDTILRLFDAKQIQVLVANPAVAMHGLNLTTASYSIYFNNSFNLEHRIQSEDRLHRIGQKNNVVYIDLITENTVEDKILDTLEQKHSVGAQVLGDKWEEWFR